MTLWDRLAKLDPALTEQQRCEHEWDSQAKPDSFLSSKLKRFTCLKCGCKPAAYSREDLARVGDGRNEERYNSLDALFALCDRLGMHVDLSGGMWISGKFRGYTSFWKEDGWTSAEAFDDDPRLALATVVVKAGEVRHET